MIELGMDAVYAEVEKAIKNEEIEKAERLVFPAVSQYPEDPQLYFYASHLLVKRESYALALLACKRSLELSPNGRAYGNLGAIYRRLNMNDAAEKALDLSIEYDPTDKNAWNNKAANHINEGNPYPGIDAAKKAIELDPKFNKAKWNLGLLQLEAGDFANGWDNYREGLVLMDRMFRSYTEGKGGEPKLLVSLDELKEYKRVYGSRPRVITWGEQGIGDEIMFSTILRDLNEYADIVFECHPRLVEIFQDSYPFVKEFHPTRKEDYITWPLEIEPCQFKCPIGDLGQFFRRDLKSFKKAADKQSPFLRADLEAVQEYRKTLEAMAGSDKHFVGVAWTGGVIRTMRWYRSCQLDDLKGLSNRDDVVLVSLQYEDDTQAISDFAANIGKPILRYPSITQHYNYKNTLNLVMALDEVVTVCQSVAHLSAAAGQVTRVLVPDKPAWRYGLTGDEWFWYGENAKLYRRKGAEWTDAISRLEHDFGVSSETVKGPRRWHVLTNLIKDHNLHSFVEVGCKEGRTTGFVLDHTQCSVVAIDPWDNIPNQAESYEDWDYQAIKDEFYYRTNTFKDRLTVINKLSLDAVEDVEMCDIVFIDAAHDYENVKKDIAAWLPKIAKGGILAGHDYQDKFPGVKQAVEESFDDFNVESDSVWWVKV